MSYLNIVVSNVQFVSIYYHLSIRVYSYVCICWIYRGSTSYLTQIPWVCKYTWHIKLFLIKVQQGNLLTTTGVGNSEGKYSLLLTFCITPASVPIVTTSAAACWWFKVQEETHSWICPPPHKMLEMPISHTKKDLSTPKLIGTFLKLFLDMKEDSPEDLTERLKQAVQYWHQHQLKIG